MSLSARHDTRHSLAQATTFAAANLSQGGKCMYSKHASQKLEALSTARRNRSRSSGGVGRAFRPAPRLTDDSMMVERVLKRSRLKLSLVEITGQGFQV